MSHRTAPEATRVAPPLDASVCFRAPLLDLGTIMGPEMAGVLIPQPEVGREKVGVSDQFLANAESYHERSTNVPHFRRLIETAFGHIARPPADALVLDVGSGSGNSVFPCLDLLEQSSIVAIDISPDLLKILKRTLDAEPRYRGRAVPVCMDATRNLFTSGCFDLVVGAAILHHLIDPQAAIITACRALKPGGCAIFFEPFENGNAILRIAYTEILKEVERGQPIAPSALTLIKALLRDYEVRAALTPASPRLAELDDKWLFTKSFFEEGAATAGFSAVTIYPLHELDQPFSHQTRINLKLGAALEPQALGDWAWEILSFYDTVFSAALKRDLLIEGTIILTK